MDLFIYYVIVTPWVFFSKHRYLYHAVVAAAGSFIFGAGIAAVAMHYYIGMLLWIPAALLMSPYTADYADEFYRWHVLYYGKYREKKDASKKA